MRHLVSGRKLKRTPSHRRSLLNSLATELFRHKKIRTTVAKAKETRVYAEKIITRAKHANAVEKETGKPDVHSRREVYRSIKDRAVIGELFGDIAQRTADRKGGYTRIVRLGRRFGDAAEMAIIELVDWNTEQDSGAVKKRVRRDRTERAKQPKKQKTEPTAEVAAPPVTAEKPATIVEETHNETAGHAEGEATE